MSKKIVTTLKRHSKFFHYYFLIVTFVPLIIFSLYSVLPPKVNAAEINNNQHLDQSLNLTIWGFLDQNSLTVKTNPPTPVKIIWHKSLIPLKNTVEIKPDGLFVPNSSYSFEIQINNRLGYTSNKTILSKTNAIPKIAKSNLDEKTSDIAPKTNLSFTFSELPKNGEIIFSSYPKFEFTQEVKGTNLLITPRKLKQGQEYIVFAYLKSKERFFGPLVEKHFTTISPLNLISTSPQSGAEVVLKQATLGFSFNKPLEKSFLESSLSIEPQLDGNFIWKDNQNLEFVPKNPLNSGTKYTVKLPDSLRALDKSELQEPLNLEFTTAGPIKVIQFHPRGGYPYINSPVEVTFNQPVDHKSAEERFSISPSTDGSFSWSGNKLIFKPKSLAVSKEYKINISPGIKSIGGEDSIETFTNSFTTTSEVNKVIGYSVQGRAINATYFGIGPKKILLVASMHGSESNTGEMLNSWISYLRNNQSQISSVRTFIIVPYLNPDGKTSNKRFNANNVDLNRNWQTPDWQSLTYWQNRAYEDGGGSAPYSEPETKALRDLVLAERPSLTITYHSNANMVLGDGISQSFGDWYANLTGYNRSNNPEGDTSSMSALGYVVTGTFEDWSSRLGNITLVVEFISASANEYQRNYPALKGLLNYGL